MFKLMKQFLFMKANIRACFTRPICYYPSQTDWTKRKRKKKRNQRDTKKDPRVFSPHQKDDPLSPYPPYSHSPFSLPFCSLKTVAKGWRKQRAFFLSFPQLSFFSFCSLSESQVANPSFSFFIGFYSQSRELSWPSHGLPSWNGRGP